ncbi:MAG TPA: FtsQ-type POTRA domain-containing protein, partial [Devosia sp.]|nr:FtsQ-type POTRA domain-containing protein [Devosia sp.]
MQQIDKQRDSEVSVVALAPTAQLPATLAKNANRALIQVKRVWVLHRLNLIRVGAGLFLALTLAVMFQARGGITSVAMGAGDIMAGRFAAVGFGIDEIAITGQALAEESEIALALGIGENTNIFNFDVDAARMRVMEIPAISDASVRKIYPNRLVVEVSEVTPVARWRVDGVTFVVDGSGRQIADASVADEALPLVIGEGAADNAQMMILALERRPVLLDGLLALSRIGERRWDMIYETGLRVQLPETGLGQAL